MRPFSQSIRDGMGFVRIQDCSQVFMGMPQNVSLVGGQLPYLNALPLMPQTETKFESTGAAAEFLLDANGKVTRFRY